MRKTVAFLLACLAACPEMALADALADYRQCVTLAAQSPHDALVYSEGRLQGAGMAAAYALHCRALAEQGLGRYHDAAADFDRVAAKMGSNDESRGEVLAQSAEAWRQAGDPAQAKARLDTLIALGGNDDPALKRLQYDALLQRSALLASRGKTLDALQDLDQAVSLDVSPERAYLARAKLLVTLRQPALAASDARSALALSPDNAEAAQLAAPAAGGR